MNSLTSSSWSSWCCRIWMRALTLEPEYWLVLAALMRVKLDSSSSDTIGGPEKKEKKMQRKVIAEDKVHCQPRAQEERNRHLLGARSFPDRWRQTHHHHPPLRCSSHLTGVSGCLCRTGPRFVSWGSQGAGVRPDHFYSSVGGVEIMQGWASFPCDFST